MSDHRGFFSKAVSRMRDSLFEMRDKYSERRHYFTYYYRREYTATISTRLTDKRQIVLRTLSTSSDVSAIGRKI